jgi:5-hydroxyisourate hydrolase-like protein (transthyretin family)
MIRYFFLLTTLLPILMGGCKIREDKHINQPMDTYDYASAWNKVGELERQGLVKTVQKKVIEIYDQAREGKNGEQLIKSLVYQGKYFIAVEEDGLITTIERFEENLSVAESPGKAILQSMLAELYDIYLTQYLWKIGDRVPTAGQEEADIRNWTPKQFVDKSTTLYLASVSDENLANVRASDFSELLTDIGDGEDLRSSLLDVLGHRAIDYFSQGKAFLSQSPDRFILNDAGLFSLASGFVAIDLSGKTGSRELSVLQLFQQLLREKLQASQEAAVLDLEIKRFQYIRRNFIGTHTDQLYEEALLALQAKYNDEPGVAEVNYYLAELYYNKGQQDPAAEDGHTNHLDKAYRLCRETIDQYPDTYGSELCRGLKSRLESKELQVNTEMVNLPKENLIAKITYKNIRKVHLRVIRLDRQEYEQLSGMRKEDVRQFIGDLPVMEAMQHFLPAAEDLRQHAAELALKPLQTGVYGLAVSDNADFDPDQGIVQLSPFFVSRLAFWHTNTDKGQLIYVVDRATGEPQSGVKVKLYQWSYEQRERVRNLVRDLTTDTNGLVSFSNDGNRGFNYSIELESDEESLFVESYLYAGNWSYPARSREKVLFFTDRSLYRPGQTVYFKGLLVRDNGDQVPEIIPFREGIEVELNDVNRQKLAELELSTNEFGSFSGHFILPETGLTGQFSISNNQTRDKNYFSVENYKRPKFFVDLEDYEQSYQLGDEIVVGGKAQSFSGINISNARVVYRVMRKSYFPFWRYYSRPNPYDRAQMEIANGFTTTDGTGRFSIPVNLLADDQIPGKFRPYFQYEILAEVTDPTGETHSDRLFMQAGWSDLDVRIETAEEHPIDSLLRIEVVSDSWNGKPQALQGKLIVSRLVQPDRVFRNRFWTRPDQFLYDQESFREKLPHYAYRDEDQPENWEIAEVLSEEIIQTNEKRKFEFSYPAGFYKIELEYTDSRDEQVSITQFTSVYSDTEAGRNTVFRLKTEGGEPGQQARILFQSSKARQPVLMEFFDNDGRIQAEWKAPDSHERVYYPIEEKHRGNFFVRIAFVRNNRFYTETQTIRVPWTNKELTFEYLTFRDKLQPGEQETWTVRISGTQKDKVMAEMLASMYDASLDDIRAHGWYPQLYRMNSMRSGIQDFGFGISRPRSFVERNWNSWYAPGRTKKYRTINWFGLEQIPGYRIYREDVGVVAEVPPRTRERMMTEKAAYAEGEPEADMERTETTDNGGRLESAQDSGELSGAGKSGDQGEIPQRPVRTNLNETVFFFPHLKTDEQGNVLIEFTMNEALTRWKFMGLAHTKDLMTGLTSRELITQKELMIRPNPPRFVRMGDQLEFMASVSNLAQRVLEGGAVLQLFDAVSGEEVTKEFLSGDHRVPFIVEQGGNQGLSWKLRIPDDGPELLEYKVLADAGSYTDGEAGYLPVLTNRVMVTETLPMWIGGEEEKTYDFKALEKMSDPGLRSWRFTLESTSNPVWYAIQAMPYIRDYREGNSIGLVNALYANLLAAEIVRQNPVIEGVFRKWKEEARSGSGSLQSQLQRNEELKGVLLSETPWLLEGLDESEQKRNIALLFDLNQVEQDKTQITSMLQNLQRHDGGFSWYPGGQSSEYQTLYVLNTLGRLLDAGIAVDKEPGMSRLIQVGVRYCDLEMAKRYKRFLDEMAPEKPDPETDYLSQNTIFYLFTRSMFGYIALPDEVREASVFYLNQLERHFTGKTLFLQGMMAMTLFRNGNSQAAKAILRSVLERSIYSEELGRYWKQPAGYHWTEFPIEAQALLTEAFQKIVQDGQIVQEMQVWLLKHKQTNRWKTPRASIAAIHALLLNNRTVLGSNQVLEVRVGGENILPSGDRENYETGTGYFRKDWSAGEITAEMGIIGLKNPNDHIAWGGVYWQYFQDIDQVKAFEDTPLPIQKEMYRAVNEKDGEKLYELADREHIEPGTKIVVRLRIAVDRPMDFIRLDDQRAAAFEPLDLLSGYSWSGGLGYYRAPGDTGTSFFIEHLPRGVYIIQYPLRAVHSGEFISGLAVIQSMYAPEFSSHSGGGRIIVE